MATTYDIIVVGGGPVGMTAANLLGRFGLHVLVVEREPAIHDTPRAITADHEMLHALQLCGLGERLESLIAPHPGTDYLGVDGRPIAHFDPLPPPFPLGWLPTATFVQPELEAMLRGGLSRFADVELRTEWQALSLTQNARQAVLTIAPAGGAPRDVTAAYVLGCDGATSTLRKAAGIELEDLAFDERWMVVDAWERRDAGLPAKCVQYCWPERPATFIRGPRDLRRWEIKMLPGEDPEAFGRSDNVRRQLARFANPEALDIWRSAVYRFHALVATKWRAGRLFLLGDAAHQTPPFMGQGLCAGIRDALNLAWKLAAVLRGGATPAMLDSYEAERRPHFRTVVARTKELGEIIGELDPAAATQRDARMRAALASGNAETIRQHFIPDLEAGIIARGPDGAPLRPAGTLFVQPNIRRRGGAVRLDDVIGPGILLVSAEAEPQHWLDADGAALWRRIGGTLVVIGNEATPLPGGATRFAEIATLFRDWMAQQGGGAVIVRPDRVVFGAAQTPAELNRLVAALAGQLYGDIPEPALPAGDAIR